MRPLTAKLLDRLVLLTATLLLAARQYDFPSKKFWVDLLAGRGYIVVILMAAIGIFGAFTPFQGYVGRRRVERKSAIRRQILERFGGMLAVARKIKPQPPLGDLGLHIWRIRRSWRHPVQGRLTRAVTYRLGSTPVTRPFSPAKGIGVVGLCWEKNEETKCDVEALAKSLTNEQEFQTYSKSNGAEAVMNFSWAEFQRFKHRGAVFASPIRNGRGKFVGCLSVDAVGGYATLDSSEFWSQVNSLCDLIGQDGFLNV